MKDVTIENQSEKTELEFLDAVVAAPCHHRVVFKNERVRMMELLVKPGETVPVHTHRWASVNYLVSPSDFLSFDAAGRVTLDSRAEADKFKPGAVFCLPPFPAPHAVENIGDGELRGISVELKD